KNLVRETVSDFFNSIGRVLPDAVGMCRPQYSSTTVGDRAPKVASQGRSDDFISRPANPC
ncbi:hypothetical protein, partial [Paraburkholderia hospita]|uniref:hypothetical protein n=1 Tax=Paraburkholderia hospita TaxID=169430 RepID=UPI000B6A7B62